MTKIFSKSAPLKGTSYYNSFNSPTGIVWVDSDKKLYVGSDTSKVLLELASQMPSEKYSTLSQINQINDIYFSSDKTKMFVLGDQNDRIYQYTLSTSCGASTASYDSKSFNFVTQNTSPSGIFFKSDRSKLYIW